jgi:hypothetical protein
VIEEVPCILTVSVVAIEHVRVSHVVRIVTEKIISKNNVLKSVQSCRLNHTLVTIWMGPRPSQSHSLRQRETQVQNGNVWWDE